MTKYQSEVKHIAYPVGNVYKWISDLRRFEALRGVMGDRVNDVTLDEDSISAQTPMGTLTLRIVEREEQKGVKLQLEGAPAQGNLWIQLLPEGDNGCAMKVTLGAELNFMTRQLLKGKLQSGVDRVAASLAVIPYVCYD